MKEFVAISDTHEQIHKLLSRQRPEGDILIHSGDHTYQGTEASMEEAAKQLAAYGKDFDHIVAICGNHDWLGERDPVRTKEIFSSHGITYLFDEEVNIDGIRIYGSPWQPYFCNWAFNLFRGKEIKAMWDKIPEGIDILVTHGPPHGIGDFCDNGHVGCYDLLEAIKRLKIPVHISGHIHSGYGEVIAWDTVFINASTCNEDYKPVNRPHRFKYEPATKLYLR